MPVISNQNKTLLSLLIHILLNLGRKLNPLPIQPRRPTNQRTHSVPDIRTSQDSNRIRLPRTVPTFISITSNQIIGYNRGKVTNPTE